MASGSPGPLPFNSAATAADANGVATPQRASAVSLTATQAIASETLTQNQPSANFTPVTGSGGTNPLSYSVSPALKYDTMLGYAGEQDNTVKLTVGIPF